MRKNHLILSMAFGALLAGVSPAVAADHQAGLSPATQLRQDMRKLWSDHVIWTRQYIVAARVAFPPATRIAHVERQAAPDPWTARPERRRPPRGC